MKKFTVFFLVAVLAASLFVPFAAAAEVLQQGGAAETGEGGKNGETPCPPDRPGNPCGEEKYKPGSIEYFFALQSKFDLLSESQKKEIYKLNDKLLAQSKKLILSYAEYGVITEAHGQKLCRALEDGCAQAKKDGKLVLGVVPPFPAA